MESLLKQIRAKFSAESQEDEYSGQEGKMPTHKAKGFKKEKKEHEEDNSANIEFGAAIAAAAYAIMSVEEGFPGKKKPAEELGRFLNKIKSRREDGMNRTKESSKISRWFSTKEENDDEDDDDDGRIAVASFKRKTSTLDERMREESAADLKMKEKGMSSAPSLKKTPTFTDKYLNDTENKALERAPSKKKPLPTFSSNDFLNGERILTNKRIRKAFDWEQAKMVKIRKRHERMKNRILEWENEKKVKANRRKERRERELDIKRSRILRDFHEEIKKIDMIASRAREVVNDTRRSDEIKVKEKAKKMASNAKGLRSKCFCC